MTPDHEIVWEWISPYYTHNEKGPKNNMIYRAYRYPYSYVPQEPVPVETPVARLDNVTFRVPGAGAFGAKKVVDVAGTLPYYEDIALCVATDDEADVIKKEKIFEVDTEFFRPVTSDNWRKEVQDVKDKPVLVLFGAERCVHCKALHPVLEEALKEEYEGQYEIRYVDVDASQDLVEAYRIGGIPVVAVYRNGEELLRFNGEKDYDDLCDILDRPLA